MSFSSIQSTIETYFAREWQNRIPLEFVNAPESHIDTDDYWCRLTVHVGSGSQISLGGTAHHKWGGVAIVQLFGPQYAGNRVITSYAEAVREILQRKTLTFDTTGKIFFGTPSLEPVPQSNYYQCNVSVTFDARQQFLGADAE